MFYALFSSYPYNTIYLHISGHVHTDSSEDSTYTSEGYLSTDTESSEDSSSEDSTYINFSGDRTYITDSEDITRTNYSGNSTHTHFSERKRVHLSVYI